MLSKTAFKRYLKTKNKEYSHIFFIGAGDIDKLAKQMLKKQN